MHMLIIPKLLPAPRVLLNCRQAWSGDIQSMLQAVSWREKLAIDTKAVVDSPSRPSRLSSGSDGAGTGSAHGDTSEDAEQAVDPALKNTKLKVWSMCMPRDKIRVEVTDLLEPTLRRAIAPIAREVARRAALTRLGQFIRVGPGAYRLWAMHTHQAKVARLAERLGRERRLRRVLAALREVMPSSWKTKGAPAKGQLGAGLPKGELARDTDAPASMTGPLDSGSVHPSAEDEQSSALGSARSRDSASRKQEQKEAEQKSLYARIEEEAQAAALATKQLRRRVRAWKKRLYNVAAIEESDDENESPMEGGATGDDGRGSRAGSRAGQGGDHEDGPMLLGLTDAGRRMSVTSVASGAAGGRRRSIDGRGQLGELLDGQDAVDSDGRPIDASDDFHGANHSGDFPDGNTRADDAGVAGHSSSADGNGARRGSTPGQDGATGAEGSGELDPSLDSRVAEEYWKGGVPGSHLKKLAAQQAGGAGSGDGAGAGAGGGAGAMGAVDDALSTVYQHTRAGLKPEEDAIKAAADKVLAERGQRLVDALYGVRQAILKHGASKLLHRIFRILRAPVLDKVVKRKYARAKLRRMLAHCNRLRRFDRSAPRYHNLRL